jgi:hypothetical protein
MPFEPTMSEAERFWSHVDKNGMFCRRLGTKCWIWDAYCSKEGYGQFRIGSHRDGSRRIVRAHVYAFELAFGKLAAGLNVLHKCDNPPCVRESHLFSGTAADNILDCVRKKRNGPMEVVSDEQVLEVLRLYKGGIPQAEIARRMGIHRQNVWNYVSGSVRRLRIR